MEPAEAVDDIKVALVNDFELVLEGLRAMLDPAPGMRIVETEVRHPPRTAVDVTLFDTYGAHEDLLDRVSSLARDDTNGAVIVFSFSDQQWLIDQLLRAGANGYISKGSPRETIVGGIRDAAAGRRVLIRHRAAGDGLEPVIRWPGRDLRLSGRESELLALLPAGYTNRELADRLYVSENTVKTQLRHLFTKLGVKNRVQASMRAGEVLGPIHRAERRAT